MRKITLGSSGLEVTPICFGCWQMGQTCWGKQPAETLINAVHAAVDAGVNFFDNADAYGDGDAERILGRALKDIPRDKVVIATKVFAHFYPDGHRHADLGEDYIPKACEASLSRLGLDCIDLYQCHSYDQFAPLAGIARAMEKLKKAGKIRAFGVSNFTVEQLRAARACGDFDTLQPPYNLFATDVEKDLLPYCQAENVGVLVYGSLKRGMLTGKFKGDETFDDLRAKDGAFQGETFKRTIEKVERLRPMAEQKGCTVTQLALAATISHPAIHCAIVGIKNAGQIREAAGAPDVELTVEEYHAIRSALG